MPFTLLHVGPAMTVKAIAYKHFSLRIFGFTQITMDIEPLIRIIRQDDILHGITHTYLVSTFVALISVIFVQFFLSFTNKIPYINKFSLFKTIDWKVALISGLTGAYSHVFLDSIMHVDIQPWYPFSLENDLLYIIPVGWLHIFCIGLGITGTFALFIMFVWKKIAIEI
jgi:membrane-bound metal-dependent hydrolase YbcI (DUF457 family)